MIETADIRTIKGVGDKTASLYNKVGIYSVYDALTYFPRDYDRYSPPVPIADIRQTMTQGNSEFHTVAGTVFGSVRQKRVRHLTITNLSIKDASGVLHLTYFNMPFLSKVLKSGSYYIFRGRVEKKGDELHMEQAKMFKEPEYQVLINTFRPRYPLTAGLSNNTLIKTVAQILNNFTFPTDHLPPAVKKNHNLIDYQTAIKKIHFPADYDDLAEARRRLVFDEFFLFIIAVRRMRDTSQAKRSSAIMLEVAETERLLEALPYRLTNAQLKVWSEITADLSGQYVMNRLIQGDVGSGKTIIAFLALLMCAANGCQGAMMAPTEVLAAQHYKALKELSDQYNLPIRPIILTGAMSAAAKREAYAKILSGEANVIIGTHALIQEKVNYKNLALVITDEQHRFGVRQRESLAGKGRNVHILVMSATPIPRTLAIIIYGDLDLSVIDELPANRKPIKNCVVNTSYRETAYNFITKEVASGHQIYIICPMVEEGELEGVENVTDYTAKLKARLPEHIEIASLHGKMRPTDKNHIMSLFTAGNIDVIVSTTVIEVGINVPNATVMMVENAERFGLSQLHQLRGRVGRGDAQSYCIFINSNTNDDTMKRLQILNKSNDGFEIAAEDLKIRGPGDLFGLRQSGIMDFQLGDILKDANVLKEAAEAADRILEEDAEFLHDDHTGLKNYIEKGMLKF